MAIIQQLSTLALKHVVDGACQAFSFVAGASLGDAVAGLRDRADLLPRHLRPERLHVAPQRLGDLL